MTLDARLRQQNTYQLRENFVSIYSIPPPTLDGHIRAAVNEKKILCFFNSHFDNTAPLTDGDHVPLSGQK